MLRNLETCAMEIAPLLAVPYTELDAIPELDFDQTADLDGEAMHDPLMRCGIGR